MQIFKTFLSKKFIIFILIGVLNTIVHLTFYNLILDITGVLIANTIAFIIASLYSYWANATFTYKQRMSYSSFWLSMIAFVIKLLASNGLALLFKYLFIQMGYETLIHLIPIPVTCVIFPIQYLIFNKIFSIRKEPQI